MKNIITKTNEEMYDEVLSYCKTKAKANGTYQIVKLSYSELKLRRPDKETFDKIKTTFNLASRTAHDLMNLYEYMWDLTNDRLDEVTRTTNCYNQYFLIDRLRENISVAIFCEILRKDPEIYEAFMNGECA